MLKEKENKTSHKIFSFEKFCQHFGEKKPTGYAPIIDAYIQYESDFFHGGYVSPNGYWKKKHRKWKCEICGLETLGFGIYSHKNKHEREYRPLFEEQYKTVYNEALKRITPHEEAFIETIEEIRKLGKIEIANYADKSKVLSILLMSKIPNEYIEYFTETQLDRRDIFSVTAYEKFKNEILYILRNQRYKSVKLPERHSCNYNAILEYLNNKNK